MYSVNRDYRQCIKTKIQRGESKRVTPTKKSALRLGVLAGIHHTSLVYFQFGDWFKASWKIISSMTTHQQIGGTGSWGDNSSSGDFQVLPELDGFSNMLDTRNH